MAGVRSALAALDGDDGDGGAAAGAAVRAALAEQLTALGERATPTSAASTTASTPAASTSPAASPSASSAPADPASLLRSTAAAARADVAGVASGTARLLACVAAGDDLAADLLAGSPTTIPTEPGPSPTPSGGRTTTAAPIPSPTPAAGSGEQGALTSALAVQEQARYGYGVLAVRLTGDRRAQAVTDLAAHDQAVDDVRARLESLGAEPPPARPAWALPAPVTDEAGAVALAVSLEAAATAAAADLVAASPRERREAAADALLESARRWQRWRSAAGAQDVVALPGLSGR